MTARYLMPSIRDCSKIVSGIAPSKIDFSATHKRVQAFAIEPNDERIVQVVSDHSFADRAEIDFGTVECLDRCTVRDKAVQIRLGLVRHEKARRN